jgi:thiol-disulfide isomerase/thioredoxin
MKKITLFLLITLSAFGAIAQKSVNFQKTNLKAVFALAKAQNKNVFLEIYAIGCPHCESFKKTFDNNVGVATYFNQKFISYQMEWNSPEFREFAKKHTIYVLSTPLMSFWDNNENLLHIQPAGDEQNNEKSLKDMADRATNPQQQSASWKGFFKQGVHDDSFLIEYGYNCRFVCDTTGNIEAMNAYALNQKPENMSSQTNFLVLQKVIMDDDNILFKNMMNQLPDFYAKFGKENVVRTAENVIMFSLYSGRGKTYSVERLAEMKANLRKIGVDDRSILIRFWMIETAALFKLGQEEKAADMINEVYKSTKTIDPKDAIFAEKYIKEKTQNPAILSKLEWIYKKK